MGARSHEESAELHRILPHWHFREAHQVCVEAPPEAVMRAVWETTWGEAPIARALVALTRADVGKDRRIVRDFLGGMGETLDAGGGEVVFVGVDTLEDRPRPEGSALELVRECADPGLLKMVMNVRFRDGVLSTETRVYATDDRTRRRFRPYWLAIRAGSGLTRTSMLRAIRGRALRPAD
ncbi:hypothetical protein [Streptomyces antioxidans]|uniref:hypothetical protein n=1 Tax=Streptomyces TaxID=1883 RepID=UPI000A8866CD|nr:hypothetical protein [Streptomyces antioxidans]